MQTLLLFVKYFGGRGGRYWGVPNLAKTRDEIKSQEKNNTQDKK